MSITYIPHLHNDLHQLMPKAVKLAPVAHDQLKWLYNIAKDSFPVTSKSNVVYELTCKLNDGSVCSFKYIGETTISLKIRVQNHKSFFHRHPTESSLFKHASRQLNEHCIVFENPRVLDHTINSSELYIHEAWEINNSNNLMNDIL